MGQVSRQYYLDWRPRASHAIEPVAYKYEDKDFKTGLRTYAVGHNYLVQLLDSYLGQVDLVCRTDGVFVFSVQWIAVPPSRSLEFNIVTLVSHYIKIRLNHVHIYDRRDTSVIRTGDWVPIHKTPVRLNLTPEQATKALLELVQTDDAILGLTAESVPFEDFKPVTPNTTPAVLRLRDKYTRAFDRTFQWAQEIRQTKLWGIQLYKRYAYYIALYLILIAAMSVHLASDIGRSDAAIVWIGGMLNTFCLWFVLEKGVAFIKKKYAGKDGKTLKDRVFDFLQSVFKPDWLIKIYAALPKMPSFVSRAELMWAAIIVGPLVLSFREFPSLLELTKIFKTDSTKEFFDTFETAINSVSISEALAKPGFVESALGNVVFYLPALVVLIYTLEVSMKRRRILRALAQLKGHLLFGNIYNAVVDGVFYRSRRTSPPKNSNFDYAVRIVEDVIALERRKRASAQLALGVVLVLAVLFSWDAYLVLLSRVF